jgi:hypothetical protein
MCTGAYTYALLIFMNLEGGFVTKDEINHILEDWRARFEKSLSLLSAPHNDVDLASEEYSKLKKLFKLEYEKVQRNRLGTRTISDEQAFLWPAVCDVYLHCSARVGSKNKEALSSSLYDGKNYLSYWITELGLS